MVDDNGPVAGEVPGVELPGGAVMPVVGLGTYRLTGRSGYDAVRAALDAGYRHLDTATMYGNEREVGRAVHDSGVDRDAVFLTTKLWPDDAARASAAIDASLRQLGVEHVDLWLIHWPPGGARPDVWTELLAARSAGKARAVGVSNYSVAQIDELIAATGSAPAVNQIAWDPGRFDASTLDAHRERGIAVQAWSPLRGFPLDHGVLRDIAVAHSVTPAQVVLRWNLQHDVVVIPKTATPDRLRENLDVFGFVLTEDEVRAIDALARG